MFPLHSQVLGPAACPATLTVISIFYKLVKRGPILHMYVRPLFFFKSRNTTPQNNTSDDMMRCACTSVSWRFKNFSWIRRLLSPISSTLPAFVIAEVEIPTGAPSWQPASRALHRVDLISKYHQSEESVRISKPVSNLEHDSLQTVLESLCIFG